MHEGSLRSRDLLKNDTSLQSNASFLLLPGGAAQSRVCCLRSSRRELLRLLPWRERTIDEEEREVRKIHGSLCLSLSSSFYTCFACRSLLLFSLCRCFFAPVIFLSPREKCVEHRISTQCIPLVEASIASRNFKRRETEDVCMSL